MKKSLLIILLTALLGVTLFAVDKPAPGKPAPPRRGPQIWQIFARLDDDSRRELIRLQQENPEEYRKKLHDYVEKFRGEEKSHRELIYGIVEQYQKCESEAEKAALRAQLETEIGKKFDQDVDVHRRHVESLKRRAEKLGAEVERRAENREKIISTITESLLSGKKALPGCPCPAEKGAAPAGSGK